MNAGRFFPIRALSELLFRLRRGLVWSRRGRLFYALLGLAVTAVLLLAGEILARTFGPPGAEVTFFQARLHFPDSEFVEDPDLFWAPVEGFRAQYKVLDAYRGPNLIYTFGGSIAKGTMASKSFSVFLEELLAERGIRSKVVNFGVQGYTSYQSRVLARKICRRRAPDILLLSNAYNDFLNSPYMTDKQAGERNRSVSVRLLFLLNKSKLFSMYRSKLLDLHRPTKENITAVGYRRVPAGDPDDYRENLEALADLAKSGGFHAVFIAQVMPSRVTEESLARYFDTMRDVAAQHPSAVFCDPRPLFRTYRESHHITYTEDGGGIPNGLFADACCHTTDLGHRLYAEAIAETILSGGLMHP